MSTSGLAPRRLHAIFLRGLIWSLIGLIYAPLFAGLHVLMHGLNLGHAAVIPAAAIAGAVCAVFYGARQVAILGSVVGVLVASAGLMSVGGAVAFWAVVVPSAAAGAVLGGVMRFPDRCSMNVPGKAVAGCATGLASGLLLSLAEPLHPRDFHMPGTLAFLVAVNGVLYVATLRWWLKRLEGLRGPSCNFVEAFVLAVLSAVAAASVWAVAAPLVGGADPEARAMLAVIHEQVPPALWGGMLGGAVGGAMLEAFGFRWVHDT